MIGPQSNGLGEREPDQRQASAEVVVPLRRQPPRAPAPRVNRAPADWLDSIDRQLVRATADDQTLARYITLMTFLRSTVAMLALALIGAGAMLGLGIGAAVYLAGLSPQVALSLGAVGSVATMGAASFKLRAVWKMLLSRGTSSDAAGPDDPRPLEPAPESPASG
ncbi:hypothetical protein ACWF9G_30340 [Nocardia sp. NPDC055029]